MTSHTFLGISIAALLAALSMPARAECPDGCTMNVIKIAGKDLRFGSLVVVSPGELILNPSTGARSGSAHVVTPAALDSHAGPAEFRVTCSGSGSTRYTVALVTTPASVETTSIAMVLSNFSTYPPMSLERTVAHCAMYEEIVKVGATLSISPAQSRGTYISATDIELEATISSLY